jgi:hypothetical protein
MAMMSEIILTIAMYFLPAYPGQIYIPPPDKPDICSGIDMNVLTV